MEYYLCMSKLEKASNMAVLIVALVAVITFAKTFQARRAWHPSAAERLKGKKIDLAGLPLAQPGVKKLVLAISATCHFCEESAPFYRSLGALRSQGVNFKLIAALPQNQSAAEDYLKQRGISADAVVALHPLAGLGIATTPTLILVGGSGQVESVWVGLLDKKRQAQVIAGLKEGPA
jgi:hypothetical protein